MSDEPRIGHNLPQSGLDEWQTPDGTAYIIRKAANGHPAFDESRQLHPSDPASHSKDRMRCWMKLIDLCHVQEGQIIRAGNVHYHLMTSELLGGLTNLARLWEATEWSTRKFIQDLEEAGFIETRRHVKKRAPIVRIKPTRHLWTCEAPSTRTVSQTVHQTVHQTDFDEKGLEINWKRVVSARKPRTVPQTVHQTDHEPGGEFQRKHDETPPSRTVSQTVHQTVHQTDFDEKGLEINWKRVVSARKPRTVPQTVHQTDPRGATKGVKKNDVQLLQSGDKSALNGSHDQTSALEKTNGDKAFRDLQEGFASKLASALAQPPARARVEPPSSVGRTSGTVVERKKSSSTQESESLFPARTESIVDGSESVSVGIGSAAWCALAIEKCTTAAGDILNVSSPALFVASRITGWCLNGADLDMDVVPAIASRREKVYRPRSVKTWNYFDHCVAEAVENRTKPLPKVERVGQSRGISGKSFAEEREDAAKKALYADIRRTIERRNGKPVTPRSESQNDASPELSASEPPRSERAVSVDCQIPRPGAASRSTERGGSGE